MNFVLSAALKDLRRHLRDPLALVLWLGMPLLIGGLLTLLISGNEEAPPRPHVLVADEDGGYVGDLFARAFAAGRARQYLQIEEATTPEARQRMSRGEASALLIVPPGFRRAVLRDEPTTLVLVTNPAQQVLPKMVEEMLDMAVEAVFYLHRLAGPDVHELLAKLPDGDPQFSDDDFSQMGRSIRRTVEGAQRYLNPPVIELVTPAERPEPAEPANAAKLFLPGILFMALLFMASHLSGDVWRERDLGTLRRAACTPASTRALLAGKLVAAATVILSGSAIVLGAGMLYFDMPLAELPGAALWSALAGVALFMMFLTVQIFASNQRAGAVLVNCVVFPLMFLGGSFFPFEAMPHWMAAVGRRTPNGWALEWLEVILLGSPERYSLVTAVAILCLVSAILFVVDERLLRRFARA